VLELDIQTPQPRETSGTSALFMNMGITAISEMFNPDVRCSVHSQVRDRHVIDIICTSYELLLSTSYSCIPLTAKSRPDNGSGQFLPGLNSSVAPLKEDSLFWHFAWKDAGSPQSLANHQVM
jgi:hypothetical protein